MILTIALILLLTFACLVGAGLIIFAVIFIVWLSRSLADDRRRKRQASWRDDVPAEKKDGDERL